MPGDQTRNIAFRLAADKKRRLDIALASVQRSQKDVIEELIEEWLEEGAPATIAAPRAPRFSSEGDSRMVQFAVAPDKKQRLDSALARAQRTQKQVIEGLIDRWLAQVEQEGKEVAADQQES